MKSALLVLLAVACSSSTEPIPHYIRARAILTSPDFRYPTGAPVVQMYVDCTYELGTGRLIRCLPQDR